MDVKTVTISSFVLCIFFVIRVKSSNLESTTTLHPLVPTVPTPLSTKHPTIKSSESKVVNSYETLPKAEYDFSREDDVEGAPPDHIVPHSEHENPAEPRGPKFPPNLKLDFVPTKLYAQVRKTHTVKRLPREEALKSATNEEEIVAAPRLRQVVSKSKKNTVYTEEGYEDAAYDHGGHIRDADFHEGYARKLGDQENIELDSREKKPDEGDNKDEEEAEGKEITFPGAEQFNDYDDDYRDHDSSIVEESKILNRIKSKETTNSVLKSPWKDTLVDPKWITENEIEKLEEDLKNEYEESEKNTETEVPENLRNLGQEDEEGQDEGSVSEADAAENQHHEKKVYEENIEPQKASAELFDNVSSTESEENEIRDISLPKPKDSENVSKSVNQSADYGKIFWDYFESLKNNEQSQEFIAPEGIYTTLRNSEKSVAEVFTDIPSVESIQTLADSHPNSNFPSTEFSDFFLTSRMDRPSAASVYESWKRQDQYENSEEKKENDFSSLASYTSEFDEVHNSDDENDDDGNPSLNLQNVGGSTTLISPKKLSYTVIIRPSGKPTTKNPPCDRQIYTEEGERTSIGKTALRPATINDFSSLNDFTAIQPPLPPVPLTQVTYADFTPVSYAGLAHPTVTREIGSTGKEINNDERDRYESMKNSYANHGPNLRPRYHRFRHHKKKSHHFLPPRKLVPPSPINRSTYSDYFGVKRIGKPVQRLHTRSNYNPWPGIVRFHQSFGRTIFRRHRRSLDEEAKKEGNETQTGSGRIRENKLRPKRNSYRESNRLAGADNAGQVKSIGIEQRKRRNDGRLLHEAPKIVDQVINNEIEARFKEEDSKDDGDTQKDDEERGKVEIEVPDFDFSEVIDDNESERVVTKRPIQQSTLNIEKYPFYANSKVPRSSALKYITNPRHVPKKTLGGTEFYDSRDRYRKCDEVEPDLDSVLPEEEQPSGDRGSRNDGPRLRGLGDTLDCFRAKYFDDDPLDNPLFLEEQVGQPRIPEELVPDRINFRYFDEPNDDEHRVVGRVSRKPELIGNDLGRSESKKHQFTYNDARTYRTGKKASATESQKNVGEQVTEKRRRKKKRPQAITSAPELLATPYQHQVYEDVMGTIKNLAGLYQTFGEPLASHSFRHNLNHASSDLEEKNIDSQIVHVTERPRGYLIRELMPRQPTESPKAHRYRIIPYRTNRVTYRTRTLSESPPGDERTRVGYFRTVTVHKRSVNDDERYMDLNAAETRNIGKMSNNNTTYNAPKFDYSKHSKVEEKPAASERVVYTIRDRIRHSKPREIFGKYGKFTNLEASATEDVRRHEPRYNRVRCKKLHPSEDEPITAIQPERLEDDPKPQRTLPNNSPLKGRPSGRYDFHDEPGETYKIQFSTTHGRQIEPGNLHRSEGDESSEDYEKKDGSTVNAEEKTQQNKYDVHENFKDDIPTIPSIIESTEKPKFFELRKYLQSDPPGYSEAFDKESNESSSRYAEDVEPQKSYKFAETRRDENEDNADDEDEDEEEERQVEKPVEAYVDEESSSKSTEDHEPSGQVQSYKESDNSEENKKTDDDDDEEEEEEGEGEEEEHQEEEMRSPRVEETTFHVEDGEKEFERFASRPFSPFESYEDPKYMDLGPRLNKPSFHHPSFSSVNNRRKKYSRASDEDESRENYEKSRYTFPWDADRSDEDEDKKSTEKSQKIERYEYPWERRERLARERRRRAKEREEHIRLYGFPDDSADEDDEEDEEAGSSNTRLHGRLVYPWEYYRVPSRNFHKAKATRRTTDNAEMSSNYRPRFSNRYKTRSFHIDKDNDPIAISGTNPQSTKQSWLKLMEKTTNRTTEETARSPSFPPSSSLATQKGRRSNPRMETSTTPSTISSTTSNRKSRIWRIATTTKKPISLKRKDGVWNEESLESESGKDEIVTGPVRKTGSNSSLLDSPRSTLGNPRKFRRRVQMIKQSTTPAPKTTERPLRRRFQNPTPKLEETNVGHEESTVKSMTERNTTPEVKSIEHRSRFSKEEIITKTSYPTFVNNDDSPDINEQINGKSPSDRQGKFLNETIKKVSITTKETPDHIYRTEEIDKNGVKGMFVSITPNNGTNSSINAMQDFGRDLIDAEERREMLNEFQDSKEPDDEDDQKISFMRDSHVLAKLLMQVPPYVSLSPESLRKEDDIGVPEGSGSFEGEVDPVKHDSGIGSQIHRVKNPDDRLYYYVEDL